MPLSRRLLAGGLLLAGLLVAACGQSDDRRLALTSVPGGQADRAPAAIAAYGCGACHTIAGIPGADATVGPPLTGLAYRQFIAGSLPNTADNLVLWIQHPQLVVPGNAMPEMGVTEQDAYDIAAYLIAQR
jgi:cytochrome c1